MGRKSRAKKELRAEVEAELRRPRTRWENAKWGLGWGIAMAVGFSLFVILRSLVRGSFHYGDYGVSAWAIAGAYGIAGVCAGPLVGLLRGSVKGRPGAVLLGVVAGVVVYGVVGLVIFGPGRGTAAAALGVGSLVGGLLGWLVSDPNDPLRAVEETARRGDAILRVSRRRNATRNRR